jgi:hypothetical protein
MKTTTTSAAVEGVEAKEHRRAKYEQTVLRWATRKVVAPEHEGSSGSKRKVIVDVES